MNSDVEVGVDRANSESTSVRRRMMELLYVCGRATTFTVPQLATILGTSITAVQAAASNSDVVVYSTRKQTVQLRRHLTDARGKTSGNRGSDVNDNDDEDGRRESPKSAVYNAGCVTGMDATESTSAIVGAASNPTAARLHTLSAEVADTLAAGDNVTRDMDTAAQEMGTATAARVADTTTTAAALESFGETSGRGGGVTGRRHGWDEVAMYSSTGGLERRAVGAPLRRRGGARGKPYMRAAKALQEKRQVLPLGQVGRVGYVCVADEFDLAGLEAHYRYLSYFTKFDFDVLHVRFADAEMLESAMPANVTTSAGGGTARPHNHSGSASSGGGGGSTWNYGATAYSNNNHLALSTARPGATAVQASSANATAPTAAMVSASAATVTSAPTMTLSPTRGTPPTTTAPPMSLTMNTLTTAMPSLPSTATTTAEVAAATAAVSMTTMVSARGKDSHMLPNKDADHSEGANASKEARTYGSHTSAMVPRGGFDLFIFEYGAVVWWGFDQRYFKIVENDFMLPDSVIAKYMTNRYTTRLVNENYPVWCTYTLVAKERPEADDDFKRRLRFDHFLIPYGQGDVNTCGVSMLCASHALAQSAKIDYLEIKVQELTESCSPLPRDLKEHGGVTISERRLLQLRGEVLSYRLMLKSGSDLLDEPDLFWENAYLKPVFQATKEGFEISERVEALDNKLDAANEILSILADEFSQRHGARLEWIVIWLVFVEVIIGVLELLVDARPWFFNR